MAREEGANIPPAVLGLPGDPPSGLGDVPLHANAHSVDRDPGVQGGFRTTAELYDAFNGLLGHHIEMMKLLAVDKDCEPLRRL